MCSLGKSLALHDARLFVEDVCISVLSSLIMTFALREVALRFLIIRGDDGSVG
jgi:hypothetical protein